MKQFKLISADIFAETVGTPEQIETLRTEALAHRQTDDGSMAFTNENCWRSRFKYKDITWLMVALEKLVNQAIDYYYEIDPLYPTKVKNYGPPDIDYWTNVNEPMSKNSMHNHALHHFVACYYIQAEGTGDIVFHNPANLLEQCHPHSPFTSRMAFQPRTGDLLVWPAWMPHEVEMNTSDMQRINIAFNIRFKTPHMIYQ